MYSQRASTTTSRHRPSSVGLGAEILLKGGCAPGCPLIFHISPYKITSDFTGFNTGSVGFDGFSMGRRSSQHNTVKARRI
eukprot:scaffold10980_cov81-Cyclotella_meneghiniana.AAC.2